MSLFSSVQTKRSCRLQETFSECLGKPGGLETNLQKSNIIPIRCEAVAPEVINNVLPCPISEFPCTYLGLPLSTKKLQKSDLMTWIEKIADKLPSWKASLMNKAGRAALVRFVLSAIPVYILIAMNECA